MGIRELRSRTALSAGVIIALMVAVWAAITAGRNDPPPTTTTGTSSTTLTTSTTQAPTTTSTTPPASTTTVESTTTTSDPDAREEEVRLILEDLYFRWFDAIYHNDEAAVREVIATEGRLQDFERAASEQDYPRAPQREDIDIANLELLRDSPNCLVAYLELDVSKWRGRGTVGTTVNVLYPSEKGWLFGPSWQSKNDLWEQDCDVKENSGQ